MAQRRHSWGGTRPQMRTFSAGNRGRVSRGNKIRYMDVDPRMLVKKANPILVDEQAPTRSFRDFSVCEVIKQNIAQKGYSVPTPIQDKVIPEVLLGRDVLGLASTGTGKTAAFLIPLLEKIMRSQGREKVLIITPTRELAVQIVEEGKQLARGTRIYTTLVIGGVDMGRQIRELARNPQIVVGTPGRIKDLTERRALTLSNYATIVLDEVDRMLDMGFIHDITYLVRGLPAVRQSLFFSATMSPKGRIIAQSFLHDPVTVQIAAQRASDNVDQDIIRVGGKDKIDVLHDLLISPGFDKVLVFGRTKHGMEKLSQRLNERGFTTTAIHGNKSQNQRQRALNDFRNNIVRVLLATDVAARGIDVIGVTHVINYELPETYDDYIHRIGRTGRADRTGVALTFID